MAAATARDVILQRLARPIGTAAERVREAIAIANNEIYRRAGGSAELAGMGCVITLAIVADGRLTIGHVGDTRLYKIRPDGIRKLTRDHSPVGELEDTGELPEPEAMRHPRRHEVFRDVGTVYRDKDEQEFVDVIEEPLEPDAALLLCSDGLSDMLPSGTIAHIMRQHAGSPERVVEALVAAANDAGGRDNITVVYAEMPLVAERMGRTSTEALTPAEVTNPPNSLTDPIADRPETQSRPASAGRVRRTLRAINGSRATWFMVGALARRRRRVGADGVCRDDAGPRATNARGRPGWQRAVPQLSRPRLRRAMPGDVVRVEPGVYRERVDVRSGADLIARVPGTVTIARPAGSAVPALSLTGPFSVRVAGITIDSDDAGRHRGPHRRSRGDIGTGRDHRRRFAAPSICRRRPPSPFAAAGSQFRAGADASRERYATLVNCVVVRTGRTPDRRYRSVRRRSWCCAAMCSPDTPATSSTARERPGGGVAGRQHRSSRPNRRRRPRVLPRGRVLRRAAADGT